MGNTQKISPGYKTSSQEIGNSSRGDESRSLVELDFEKEWTGYDANKNKVVPEIKINRFLKLIYILLRFVELPFQPRFLRCRPGIFQESCFNFFLQ
jgi:hypothetical protein